MASATVCFGRPDQVDEKRLGVGKGRRTVDTISHVAKMDLVGMARRACKAEPPAATGSCPTDKPDRQPVGIRQPGILGKIAILENVLIVAEECLRIRLLEVEKPVVGNQLRALFRVVKGVPFGGAPALFEKLDLLDRLAVGVGGCST